eukprot:411689_1
MNVNFDNIDAKCNSGVHMDIIKNCQQLKRLCLGLQYYTTKMKEEWHDFCLNIYGHKMLDDYSHVLSTHSDQTYQIKNELITIYGFEDCLITNCKFSSRHFNRNEIKIIPSGLYAKKNDENGNIAFYEQEYDSVHFNIFHLFDIGYRFDKHENSDKQIDCNDRNCIDDECGTMIQKIKWSRDKYKNHFCRFKTENNKYNINVKYNITNGQNNDKTFIDKLFQYLISNQTNHIDLFELHNFFIQQEYDSDALQQDIHNDIKNSNIMLHSNQINCIYLVNEYIICSQEMQNTFGTGIIFYYWPYFKGTSEFVDEIESFYNINDYSGHNKADLYISSGKYSNMMEEAINSGFCNLTSFKQKIVSKSKEYIHTNVVKMIKAKYSTFDQAQHYGIKKGETISLFHIQSVILYTDISELSTSFSSTFRAIYFGEHLKSIKKRNRNYYNLSKTLRETVECFGNTGDEYGSINHIYYENGPFYCG